MQIQCRSVSTRRLIELFVAIGTSIFFVAQLQGDSPLLRHDWPALGHDWRGMVGALSGWSPVGLGSPTGYPSSFLVSAIFLAIEQLCGASVTNACIFFVIAVLIIEAARRLTHAVSANTWTYAAVAGFMLFNPWTYTECVAGHFYMLLGYAATLGIAAELLQPALSLRRLVLLTIPLSAQIQFFVIGSALYAYAAIRRGARPAGAAYLAMATPIVVGVFSNHESLSNGLYTLAWEKIQSVDPLRAVVLDGYFAHYAAALGPVGVIALVPILICAACGVAGDLRRKSLVLPMLALLPAIWATGVLGPVGPAFAFITEHVPESALFRELYDLLAYLTLFYAVYFAAFTAKRPRLAALSTAFVIAGIAGWYFAPPARYWVGARAMPTITPCTKAHERIALFPALQPLSYIEESGARRGLGLDPDAKAYANDITTVNEMLPVFPASSALAEYAESGRPGRLAALSVACIITRPYLTSDFATLAAQLALPASTELQPSAQANSNRSARNRAATEIPITPLPELTFGDMPRTVTSIPEFGDGNLFFADAPGHRFNDEIRVPKAAGRVTSARADWVDARLAFTQKAALGQFLGGVISESAPRTFRVHDSWMLAYIDGMLSDAGYVQRGTGGYRWYRLPAHPLALHCAGTCVIAAFADHIPSGVKAAAQTVIHDNAASPRHYTSIQFETYLPWLVRATIPAGADGLLRYNVRYDSSWAIFGARGDHVRVDGVVNGWLVKPRNVEHAVWLIEMASVRTAASELFAILVLIGVTAAAYFREKQRALT